SALTVRAIDRAALAQPYFFQGCGAVLTIPAATAIHQQLLGKVTGLAIATNKVAQGRPALGNGAVQYGFYFRHQPLITHQADFTGWGLRGIPALNRLSLA